MELITIHLRFMVPTIVAVMEFRFVELVGALPLQQTCFLYYLSLPL